MLLSLSPQHPQSRRAAMTDIVERLNLDHSTLNRLHKEAADEITRLRQLLSEADKREREARVGWAFAEGDLVRKKSGSWWEGRVVGTYSTEQTRRGYAVQLDKPFGPVQIYPESALELAFTPMSEAELVDALSALQSEER
jgi:hypothetical protein